ncbi:alpha/beta hydrolase [Streptomyces sp. HNM0574]|uniref:alpha/beta fold hydrolase n=1 Tax=Streptomyces sp. HNM0574 TaxID=2714954 RepID=UPI00146F06E4|nr:alpha/beta hydrolase [Streptomyces sp. HNM0574]NLU66903.1 alpha/beta hydrolase [Streptomyces sp. HNM0574]
MVRAGGASWGRRAGLAGAAIGAVAAGVAVERLTVQRGVRRSARLTLDAAGPYGTLRGTPATVEAEDGTALYYETEEPADGERTAAAAGDGVGGPTVDPVRIGGTGTATAARGGSGRDGSAPDRLRRLLRLRRAAPPQSPAPTVVFTHGYCLDQDSWHFQRAAFRGAVRCVYWDQRSHGRSGRGPVGEEVSVDDLGRDLKRVLDAAVPEGPVVLVGHSMGGMTVMALAAQYPEYVAERVTGVAFLDTSAGGLDGTSYGLPLPAAGVRAVRRAVPGVLKALVAQAELVERGRRAAADLFAGLVKRYSFGSVREVDPGVARFAERMIEAVPVDVVAEFYPAFEAHEKTAALAAFDGVPALVLAGDRDLLTPHAHSETIAAALPASRLVTLERTGHLAMLERPAEVNDALAHLITRAVTGDDGPPDEDRDERA